MISFDLLLLVFAAILGAVLGSFLNALTFRYNTGFPLWRAMQGRSQCMRCGHELGALDLVPIVSWLFLRGRCRYCAAPISVQYPLVETAAAVLSLGVLVAFPAPLPYAFWLLVWITILFLVVYDWRHLILPMGALVLLAVLGFASIFFSCDGAGALHLPDLWQLLAGPLLALPLFLLSTLSRGRWMGLGDSIFALPLGWMLGLAGGFTALALAFWSGAIIGLILVGLSRILARSRISLRSEIPFGPFLAFGTLAVFFFHLNVFGTLVR